MLVIAPARRGRLISALRTRLAPMTCIIASSPQVAYVSDDESDRDRAQRGISVKLSSTLMALLTLGTGLAVAGAERPEREDSSAFQPPSERNLRSIRSSTGSTRAVSTCCRAPVMWTRNIC